MGSSDSELEAVRKICPSCSVEHEQPQHVVQLDSFAILQFEVTNEQYRRCVRAGVCNRPANRLFELQQLDQYPVTDIDWEDAAFSANG